jgi:hypothetical protein
MATAQSQSKATKSRQPARARKSEAEELSGERDEHYNLISVLYHGLQGADQGALYAEDADEAGDEELAEFFRAVGQKHGELAQEAKRLLVARMGQGAGRSRSGRAAARSEDADEDDDEIDDSED